MRDPDPFDFVTGDAQLERDSLGVIGLDGRACVVYVGDTEYDIVEAHAAGAWAIGYSGGYRTRSDLEGAGADAVIDRLDAIPGLVPGLDGRAWTAAGSRQPTDDSVPFTPPGASSRISV